MFLGNLGRRTDTVVNNGMADYQFGIKDTKRDMRKTKLPVERICRVIIEFFDVQIYFLSCWRPCKFLISVIMPYFIILWSVACLTMLYFVVSLFCGR